ncbi:MAG: prepilin peptidase [Candidatus Absconditabacteria bacterium]
MELLLYFFLFVLGACFGSFGSVLIWRLKGEITKDTINGILYGRSECPTCKTILGASDLVPIFSWLFNKGKCAHCGGKVSSFYIFLEILSGIAFVFSYWFVIQYLGYSEIDGFFLKNLIFMIGINWMLVLVVMSDLLFYEMSDIYRIMMSLWIVIWQFTGNVGNFQDAFFASLIFLAGFGFIYLFGRAYVWFRFKTNMEGFGFGDVIIGFLVGLMYPFFLGDISNELGDVYFMFIIYMFFSSFTGILFSVGRNLIHREPQGQSIPFLPAMVVSFWILLVYGNTILQALKDLV